jgi:predicted Fe-Mo cluster-binding NifX family protein
MKIAIATNDYTRVAGHAGQARHWLLYDSDLDTPEPRRIQLEKAQVFHHWDSDAPHPLDGISVIVAGSAGDGFLRRMTKRGVQVLLTGERDATRALSAVLNGELLPDPTFDPSLLLCRLRDLFSKH